MGVYSTIDEVLQDIPRFRVLCVGRSGVGKSSLVNRIFGIKEACVSDYAAGDASIDKEFVSNENKHFVLHDSKGFEPGDNTNFDLAARFLEQRRREKLLKDRLHAIWLCIETPRAGGRVLEEGDKKLLALSLELKTPVVVVFTKYDKLVRSERMKLEDEEEDTMNEETLRATSQSNASEALAVCVRSLDESMVDFSIPTPPFVNISVSKGYEESVVILVNKTCEVVHSQSQNGDSWLTWAVAQRASLPVKISACVDKGVNFYYRALAEGVPTAGKMLLWQCLAQVHKDIVACWNFKDESKILEGPIFRQRMLRLVQDLRCGSPGTPTPSLDQIAQIANLITAGNATATSRAAVAGLTFYFLKWVLDTVLQHAPEVECLFMAYSIDLISVLKLLFDHTLRPKLGGVMTEEVLDQVCEEYEHSNRRKEVHNDCLSLYESNRQALDRDHFRQTMKEVLDKAIGLKNSESGSR